jgi:hypothetical protein
MIGRCWPYRTMFHHLQSSVIPDVAPYPCSKSIGAEESGEEKKPWGEHGVGMRVGMIDPSLHVPMFLVPI